jgi:phosphate transport system substrate-binding protein
MKNMIFAMMLFMAFFSILFIPLTSASEELVIVGTGSGVPVLEAVGKAFSGQNPGMIIKIPESIGSGGGIKAVGNDDYILGRVARDIQEKEKRYGLVQRAFVKIPIVFFVNRSVPVSGITSVQACGIYNGTIRKWEEISSGNGKIRVIRREDGDSSLLVLQETLSGFKVITLTPRSKTTYTDQETMEECAAQKNSIAFGSLADAKHEKGVRVLELDGINPSDPQYPCIGILSLIYKEKNYNGIVKQFMEFISSDEAKKAIMDAGGLPVK